MILNALNDLYSRLADDSSYEIAKPGYSPQNISFRVVLRPDGSLFAIQDARIRDDKGKLRADKQLVLGEAKPSGSGINPGFLWDNFAYMLSYKKDDPKPERTEKSFHAFRDAHLKVEQTINHKQFSTVCRFLENWSAELAAQYIAEHPELDELTTGFGIFSIQGETKSVNEQYEILSWWDNREPASDATTGQCLITGAESVPIARLHPKIKSVAGAQSSGASLVSFNAKAYESYGKDQSFNAPVSEKAAFQYGTALNSLLNGPKSTKHRIRIGDTTCVFWTDKPSVIEDVFGIFASEGSNAQVQDENLRSKVEILLKQIQLGAKASSQLDEDPEQTRFFLLGLAPNAARLSVRFFHQSTVAELLAKLRAHHQDINIVREWDTPKGKRLADPEFPAYWQLLSQTARVADEIPPLLGGALMRAILENTHYPEALYAAVLRRIRADRTINYYRAAIIKGVLTRNHKQTISVMLDTENKEPAYLLGRLFATLEKTQTDALGELNAGLREKFYSSASATPASVFPRILRTYQHHLAKLSGGQKVNRERLVQDILADIPASGFPTNLNLKSQGIFALGYYHQRKDFFTKKDTSN
ncbi:type I-C CRISPR-associated protein Cas8c/Csd1 [Persicirhabdus sediminis]|uniref:Type I-C CRISPR-associated protein Cas8c/Csd1 n=1 Tax=Persicirhabdus sediminis TaxID=454144 RepID=A0A8J7MGF8_9BACT|nr:type I-C CRISPR-associated protein Cas8c/Csd1 [Persicirhabdus sediminis]MBK1792482.1 type I-C CRISPR-associated protein Cas8c/Csd1 [Persicirhabdus sediminis]